MKLGDLPIPKEQAGRWPCIVRWGLGGLLMTLGTFEGRSPLGIALLAAARSPTEMLAALGGGVTGALLVMEFAAGLRYCGILVLVCSACAAFRDTEYPEREWFRPAAAAGATAAVELAYLIQARFRGLFPYLAYVALAGLLCHYLTLLLARRREHPRESGLGRLRRRLELSAAAFRDLYNSFGRAAPAKTEENPAVVFDRAAEATCRGCRLCPVWSALSSFQ